VHDSIERIAGYYNPSIALYFRWLHVLSKAMWLLFPVLLLHELYILLNDKTVDDFDNKATILLCIALVAWAALVCGLLQRPPHRAQPPPDAALPRLPKLSFRVAAALCVCTAFVYVAYKVNEAKLVYLLYQREDMERDGGDGASGLAPQRIYRFLVQVQLLRVLIVLLSTPFHHSVFPRMLLCIR
jgi:hypothetical protein